MISWMQKHKKYLVITIWISTIAFVGAGFVGWGSYKFGSSSSDIAKVGDTEITIKEFNQRYQNIFSAYNKAMGGKLDEESAKKMGLDKLVLNQLIQEALLVQFAKDNNLIVTDEEVAQKIASMEIFYENGTFSKKRYLELLATNHIRPKDFEASLKKEILLQKVQMLLEPKIVPLEFDTIGSALFIGDKIEYRVLSDKDISVSVTEEELKKYYNSHKDEFLTPKKYILKLITLNPATIKVDKKELQSYYQEHKLQYTDKDGKILPFKEAKALVMKDYQKYKAKKEALREYIAFKKGKTQAQKELEVALNDPKYQPLLQKIKKEVGSFSKPIFFEGEYWIVKLNRVIQPEPIPYKKAKDKVKKAYLAQKIAKMLLKKAKEMVKKGFSGIKTKDFITREDVDKIKNLSPFEAATFLNKLFTQQKPQGFISLSQNKVILYKILGQKLIMENKISKNKDMIESNAKNLKEKLQNINLIKKLEKIYPIEIYKGL